MPIDERCDEIQNGLIEAFLERRDASTAEQAHAAACPACGAATRDLAALSATLLHTGELPVERFTAIRLRVAHELAEAATAATRATRESELPQGFGRELLRLLAWSLLPLPLALIGYALLLQIGGALLGFILPEAAVFALGLVAAFGAASWLALIYGSLPFFARRQVLARQREVLP